MSVAWAHSADVVESQTDFGWSFEPFVLLPMLVAAALYQAGSRRAGWRLWLFWSGFAAIAIALLSPLHEFGEHVFAAHMVEHEMLMVVGVPLIVASQAGPVMLRGLPEPWKVAIIAAIRKHALRRFWGAATQPVGATVAHALVLWLWHLPALFQAALRIEGLHILQHLSFILSAAFFWQAIIARDHRRFEQPVAALVLFFTSLQAGFLGAVLTFSSRIWYPDGPDPFPVSGLTRAEDQSLAGLIMWIPACTIYVIAALIILSRWLRQMEVRHG